MGYKLLSEKNVSFRTLKALLHCLLIFQHCYRSPRPSNSGSNHKLFIYLLFIYGCMVQLGILVLWPEVKTRPLAVTAWSPNHWATRELFTCNLKALRAFSLPGYWNLMLLCLLVVFFHSFFSISFIFIYWVLEWIFLFGDFWGLNTRNFSCIFSLMPSSFHFLISLFLKTYIT